MAVFPRDADTTHPADFALVRDGGLALFRHETSLAKAEGNLLDIGYAVVHLDASDWDDELTLHQDLAFGLRFPSYYGRNLDALDECLYDVAHGDYGWNIRAEGLCISLRNFAGFSSRSPQAAAAVTASFANASRVGLLFGNRVVWLLHVDDPAVAIGQVGCRTIAWLDRLRS